MLNIFAKKPDDGSVFAQTNYDLKTRQQTEMANTIVRELDRLFDRITELPLYRREAVRCLIAAAGALLQVELSGNAAEYRQIDATSRELIGIALKELGLEIKD